MNLSLVFKASAAVLFINGLMALFMTNQFMSMADFDVTADMHTLGQFMGVTFLIFGLIAWKTVDLAGDNLAAFGKVYALAEAMWVGIIGFHVATGVAGGATAIGNLAISSLFAVILNRPCKKMPRRIPCSKKSSPP